MSLDYSKVARIALQAERGKVPPSERQDAYQDAMVAAWSAESSYDEAGSKGLTPFNWAIIKARYAIIDGLRKRDASSRRDRQSFLVDEYVPAWRMPALHFEAIRTPAAQRPWERADGWESRIMVPGDANEEELRQRDMQQDVTRALAGVRRPRDRDIVVDYFFGERLMREIAAERGLTEGRVSQIISTCCAQMRGTLERDDGL